MQNLGLLQTTSSGLIFTYFQVKITDNYNSSTGNWTPAHSRIKVNCSIDFYHPQFSEIKKFLANNNPSGNAVLPFYIKNGTPIILFDIAEAMQDKCYVNGIDYFDMYKMFNEIFF